MKVAAIILILFVGLLNFHIPHFLIESHNNLGLTSYLLELVLLADVIAAIVASFGIYRNRRWGYILGIIISVISFLLYLLQETVGLPGLPQNWLEPSRIVSLIVEASFVLLARSHLKSL